MKRSKSSLLWGIIFIFFGIYFALNSFGWIHFNPFFKGWWTLFIIVPSILTITSNKDKTSGIIGLFIGVLLLLSARGYLDWGIFRKLIIPVIFVALGIRLLIRPKRLFHNESTYNNSSDARYHTEENNQPFTKSILAIFNSRVINVGGVFKSTDIVTVFGSVKLDLRNAVLTGDVAVDAVAVFGSIDILVPDNVIIIEESVPVLGSINNRVANPTYQDGIPVYKIYLNAVSVCSGIEVKR